MSKVETGRYSDLLRRTLGMKGVTEVAAELSPELSPVFVLETERPEWEFLKNEKLVGATFQKTGEVALASAVRLSNPAASGVVAVFSRMHINSAAAGIILWERNTDQGVLASLLPTVARDTRWEALTTSVLLQSVAAVGASGDSFGSTVNLANVPVEYVDSIVLTPGQQVQMTQLTVNTSIRGYWTWRERRLDALEIGTG